MPCHEQGSRLAARKDHAFARAILYFFRLCDSVGITTLRETADNPPSRPLEIPRRPGERNVMECPPFNQRSLHSRSAFPRRHRSRLWRKIVRYEKERSSSAFSERKGTSFIGVSEPKGTGFFRVSDLVPNRRDVVEQADQACAHGIHNNPTYPVAVVLAGGIVATTSLTSG